MGLDTYQKKRDFRRTKEPKGAVRKRAGHAFVIQKHAASRLHYDFRLEMNGVLKSWAVPKGPSLDPADKRLAVHVEDHPIEYGAFEGTIPENEYGGGTVMLWDRGEWEPEDGKDPVKALESGKLKFVLNGERLHGAWALVRMGGKRGDGDNWLLIKEKDDEARPGRGGAAVKKHTRSVSSGRTMAEIEQGRPDAPSRARSSSSKKKRSKDGKRTARRAASADLSLDGLEGARKQSQPASFKPELATLVEQTPDGDHWLHEVKFDGYRILAFIRKGSARLVSRNGKNWTSKFSPIAKQLERLHLPDAILDGELVALSDEGEMDFQALQNVLKDKAPRNLAYYVFDLPWCEGYDLTGVPLLERKRVLRTLLETGDTGRVKYCDHIRGGGGHVYAQACRMKLEGVISKRAGSLYRQRRTRDWVKSKCRLRQEFVIGGYTAPAGSRSYFGALLLGYYDGKDLVYCGRVGTGFDEAALKRIHGVLSKIEVKESPFANPPTGREAKGVTWVSPKQVAEVEFVEWTDDGRLRHPAFQGLRGDKPAKAVVKEKPAVAPAGENKGKAGAAGTAKIKGLDKEEVAGVTLTNPGRVLYPDQGITKRALAEYYEAVADWVLPHVVDRPLSIVRCPEGHDKECFYQKHRTQGLPDTIDTVSIKEKSATREYIVVHDLPGVVGLVQIGALEIHPWGCRIDHIDRPDHITFDLDPDAGVSWDDVKTAARRVREVLEEAGLEAFLKTSGGKGLHVVIPITRRNDWDEVKSFAQAVAKSIVRSEPKKYLATASKAKRKGKIFIDYLRNARGATSVAPYSTRARHGAPVSTPIGWDELEGLASSGAYTVENIRQRLGALQDDPWKGFEDLRQSVTKSAWSAVEAGSK